MAWRHRKCRCQAQTLALKTASAGNPSEVPHSKTLPKLPKEPLGLEHLRGLRYMHSKACMNMADKDLIHAKKTRMLSMGDTGFSFDRCHADFLDKSFVGSKG